MNWDQLQEGLEVVVNPTDKSQTKHPFKATVVKDMINWMTGSKKEWCIEVKNPEPGKGKGAVINDSLLERMTIL